MKRADVKIGTEYAVGRRGYYSVARVLIVEEATRKYRSYGEYSISGRAAVEKGFTGKLIKGHYLGGPGYGIREPGESGFVRPRDIQCTWAVQEEGDAKRREYEAEREAKMQAAYEQRLALVARIEALGIDPGIKLGAGDERAPSERITMGHDALVRLVDMAEAHA